MQVVMYRASSVELAFKLANSEGNDVVHHSLKSLRGGDPLGEGTEVELSIETSGTVISRASKPFWYKWNQKMPFSGNFTI